MEYKIHSAIFFIAAVAAFASESVSGVMTQEPPRPVAEEESPSVSVELGTETQAAGELLVYPGPPAPPHAAAAPLKTPEEPAQDEGISLVKAGWGEMKISSVMQALLVLQDITDKGNTDLYGDEGKDLEFKIKRMRIIITGGFLDNKIGYLIQGDMINEDGFLLDARAIFRPFKGIELRIGRMVPSFTYYMPQNTGRLMLIDYPVVIAKFATWWQVGLDAAYKHEYFEIIFGLYNGVRFKQDGYADEQGGQSIDVSSPELAKGYMSATSSNLKDNDTGKDILVRILGKPFKGFTFGAYLWYGLPQYTYWVAGSDIASEEPVDSRANLVHFGIEARYLGDKFCILAEYAMRRIDFPGNATRLELRDDGHVLQPINKSMAHGAYLHVGYRFIKHMEIMLRGDFYDADMNKDGGREIWPTLGVNYYLDGIHARVTLEYIVKIREKFDSEGQMDSYLVHGVFCQLCLVL